MYTKRKVFSSIGEANLYMIEHVRDRDMIEEWAVESGKIVVYIKEYSND